MPMVRMGRYTAALLLIATGVALVLDQTSGSQYLRMLIDWWPVIFILLGAEVILISLIYRNNGGKLGFSFGSIVGAVIIMLLVMVLTGFGEGRPDNVNWRFWEYGWKQYEKPVEYAAIDSDTKQIRIRGTNGWLILRSGETEQVEIRTVVQYSNFLGEESARTVEQESTLQITEGEIVEITANGKEYRQLFWQGKARMNMTVTVPAGRELDYQLEFTNGDVSVAGLDLRDQLVVRTTNGDIEIRSITGSVDVTTRNGDIHIANADSDVSLETSNGDITIENTGKSITANTSNGDIDVLNAVSAVAIRTSNGDIAIASSTVGGNWKVDTTNGDIELRVPEQGDYRIRGEGDIDTSIPWLTRDRGRVEGQTGNGRYLIDAATRNGDLDIKYSKRP